MHFGADKTAKLSLVFFGTAFFCGPAHTQNCRTSETANGLHVVSGDSELEVEILGPNLLRIDIRPHGETSPRTPVMDSNFKSSKSVPSSVRRDRDSIQIRSSEIEGSITCRPTMTIAISDGAHQKVVEQVDPFGQAAEHSVTLVHDAKETLYGMSGVSMNDVNGTLIRNSGSKVSAGVQGEAGGPWFFTARYGVLIDSDGGTFAASAGGLRFSGDSRGDVEYFVMTGPPMTAISTMSALTGRPPMPPKWTLGFLNSQWGSSQAELLQIADIYHAKQIPIDAFIMDFDWKAWGEDHYGEWRWNSTSGPGGLHPDKFPDGASGLFGKEMAAKGIHLAGILKPRILLYKPGSTTEMLEPAAYAQAHDLWVPHQKEYEDYFTGRLAKDLDFSKQDTRTWYWEHLEATFDNGMAAWWNDEADNVNNLQFLNMGRALYDGQRGHSNVRVWSINRNYYLGSQRYGYAEWSGDIKTGFPSMAQQRVRMLATLNDGEPHWSMDTGGFSGHPNPENYARWMEFAAFVPIDRVHGDLDEKRQPWVYGPIAEQAATKALRLRYSLLPYLYSNERMATETGVGIVRPLFWMFPNDPQLASQTSSWMFGDALLVSPVIAQGETEHSVYLPAGVWYDYFHGTRFEGNKSIQYPVNPDTWDDIPLFIRAGSILASQPPLEHTGQQAIAEVTLDVFPSARPAHFIYYDDDGATYAYERGVFYRQSIQASTKGTTTLFSIEAPSGSLHSVLRSYLIHIHESTSTKAILMNGKPLRQIRGHELQNANDVSWFADQDKFGPFVTLRVPAQQTTRLELRQQPEAP